MTNTQNIIKIINQLLSSKSTNEKDRELILTQLNSIFCQNLTLKQINQLKNLIELLQEKYIIAPENPCIKCGKYFLPGEGAYHINNGKYLCEKCHTNKFKTDREWNKYAVIVNAGGNPDDDFDPTYNVVCHLSDDELDKLADEYCNDDDAIVYFTRLLY